MTRREALLAGVGAAVAAVLSSAAATPEPETWVIAARTLGKVVRDASGWRIVNVGDIQALKPGDVLSMSEVPGRVGELARVTTVSGPGGNCIWHEPLPPGLEATFRARLGA